MPSKTFTVKNPAGLHARPATAFVQKATSFPCDVNVIKGAKKVNGKSIMGLMTLAVSQGDEVTLEVEGEQAETALQELGAILEAVHE